MSLFIRDWEVVSPIGVGRGSFGEVAGAAAPLGGAVFEKFDKKHYLGNKGVRGMDALGAYATVASALLVQRHPELLDDDRARVGVVLGTGTGSFKSQIDFIRDLHINECVEWVDPIQFPQTVMNSAAGQIAIWHRFMGVNATVSAGYHSGISALRYAGNMLRNTRVETVLVGCAEEHSVYSKYGLPCDSRNLRHAQQLGEGCVLFLAAGKRMHSTDIEIISMRRFAHLRRHAAGHRARALSAHIANCLALLRRRGHRVGRICFNRFSLVEPGIVASVVNMIPEAEGAALLCSNEVVADCMAANAGFQIALLAAAVERCGSRDIDIGLTFDPEGGVAISMTKFGERE